MYLSRLILDLSSRQVWSEIARPYEMHRTLMRAFPEVDGDGSKARANFDVLFRADVDERRGRVTVYVQSAVEPDWSFLETRDGYLLAEAEVPNPACKNVTGALERLETGQVLSFRLRANPTKRIPEGAKNEDKLKGKRVGLLREDEQVAWLIRKGQEREKDKPGGLEILMAEVEGNDGQIHLVPRVNACPEGNQRDRKSDNGSRYQTTHLAVRFEGLLRITDADAFRETIVRGIGPGKAFGFGLLSVART